MGALLGVFGVLWWLRTRVAPAGALFCIYLALTAAVRFLVEVVRTIPS
jgi:prolipoprotein diacylglyceryltransferase